MPGEEVWAGLAAAGGTAVVQAAGKDTWDSVRNLVAKLLGRDRADRTRSVLEQLDATAAELDAGLSDVTWQTRQKLAAAWQARFEVLLEELEGITECHEAADRLREVVALVGAVPPTGPAGANGVAVSGAGIHAEGGSVAAGIVQGGIRIANPLRPGSDRG